MLETKDLFGCHVSISGGVEKSPERARELTCDVMQIFTANQRRWQTKPISSESAESFKTNLAKNKIQTVMSHDSYLINLCAVKPDIYEKSLNAFIDEINRCKALDVKLLNFHPGSHGGAGEKAGVRLIAESLKKILPEVKGNGLKLVLENTAGMGASIGWKFEHLAEIIGLAGSPEDFGVCIDTCHAFAAGYDFRTEAAFDAVWREFDDVIGLKFLSAIHVNDSKGGLGSRLDRHDNPGDGMLGETAFKLLVNDDRLKTAPMFLETPGGDEAFKKNLKLMRKWVKN